MARRSATVHDNRHRLATKRAVDAGCCRCDGRVARRRRNEDQYDHLASKRQQMTIQRKYARAATSGFTLIEALVAIAMMAIILAALATVTAQWMPNWNHGFARLQRSEDIALGLGRIADDLAAAEFIPASRETRKPLFEGGSRSVIFVRTAVGPNSTPAAEII